MNEAQYNEILKQRMLKELIAEANQKAGLLLTQTTNKEYIMREYGQQN